MAIIGNIPYFQTNPYNIMVCTESLNKIPAHVFSKSSILASNHSPPELHKRCHRPLDPLALALSTCHWVMEISKKKMEKIPRNMGIQKLSRKFQKFPEFPIFQHVTWITWITKNHLQAATSRWPLRHNKVGAMNQVAGPQGSVSADDGPMVWSSTKYYVGKWWMI